jgi:hypothetical protein
MRAVWNIISTSPEHAKRSDTLTSSYALITLIAALASGTDPVFAKTVHMINELIAAP